VEVWSPAKIARAREYQAEAKEARKVQKKKNKFEKETRDAAT
jgi:hypothetical protein